MDFIHDKHIYNKTQYYNTVLQLNSSQVGASLINGLFELQHYHLWHQTVAVQKAAHWFFSLGPLTCMFKALTTLMCPSVKRKKNTSVHTTFV